MLRLFPAGHFVISVMFIGSAFVLLGFAAHALLQAVWPFNDRIEAARIDGLLDCIALLTIAVASLELGQTIVEEEIQRASHMSSPSRVRRFLSRFLVVLVVALSIEALVAVFRFSRDDPSRLPYAAAIGLTAAALLAGWGLFIRLNLGAEELEPEALAAAKQEDHKVENAK
ncbi:MAG TPA: hypothetical protein VFQ20_07390 [Burkholderiaceae bacterium]|nr:hypothetical protein [Burkholderiaceae bacterium]